MDAIVSVVVCRHSVVTCKIGIYRYRIIDISMDIYGEKIRRYG